MIRKTVDINNVDVVEIPIDGLKADVPIIVQRIAGNSGGTGVLYSMAYDGYVKVAVAKAINGTVAFSIMYYQ